MYKIGNYNRDIIIERYVDDIVGGMDFLETKQKLKSYLMKEKYEMSDDDLEWEIIRRDPSLFGDLYVDELLEEVLHA